MADYRLIRATDRVYRENMADIAGYQDKATQAQSHHAGDMFVCG